MSMLVRDHRLHHHLRRVAVIALAALILASVATLIAGSVFYLVHPRWAAAPAPDSAPALPIVVAGVVFNVPPAAIRVPLQRRAGAQERIDLAYRWPDLTPPDSQVVGAAVHLFVTIESATAPLPAAERLKAIYPRYADGTASADASGLALLPFRDGTPYQGEDALYDPAAPDRFLVRCSRRRDDLTLAMCLYERTRDAATLTFRFPRSWLADWHAVADGIDRLVERWRPNAR